MSDKFLKNISSKIKKLNTAVDKYTKIGKIPAMPYRAFLNLADFLFMTGCYEQSEKLLNDAVNFASKSSDAIVSLGAVKQTKGEVEEAVKLYKQALEKDSKNVKALVLWGNCLSIANKHDEAIEKYEQAAKINNKSADAYLYWGIALLKKKDFEKAKEKLESAVLYNNKDARALFMLASVEIELRMYDEALKKLQFIIANTENNFTAYHNIAYIYFKQKDYDKAVVFAQKSLKIMPFKLETYLLLGDTYVLVGKEKDALSVYSVAEKNNLKSLFLYLSWGTTLQNMKQYEEAIEKFKKGIECNSTQSSTEIYARLSRCFKEIGNIDEAKINAEKAIETAPANHIANEVLSEIYIENRDYDKAIEVLKICEQSSSSKAKAYHKLAFCYDQKEDYNSSNRYYEKAIEYDIENYDILYEYADSLNKQKEYEKALKKLITLEKHKGEELNVLELIFNVNYNIAKGNLYSYNGKKAITVAEKIKDKYPESFKFENEYNELKNISRE